MDSQCIELQCESLCDVLQAGEAGGRAATKARAESLGDEEELTPGVTTIMITPTKKDGAQLNGATKAAGESTQWSQVAYITQPCADDEQGQTLGPLVVSPLHAYRLPWQCSQSKTFEER